MVSAATAALITAPAPLPWVALGYIERGGVPYYLFDIDGKTIRVQPAMLFSVTGLAQLDQDLDRWSRLFPSRRRSGIDAFAAGAWVVSQCRAAQARRDAAAAKELSDKRQD